MVAIQLTDAVGYRDGSRGVFGPLPLVGRLFCHPRGNGGSARPSKCASLARFARDHGFRLWSPMPGVGDIVGDIDPEMPGRLPPFWDRCSRI